MSKAAEILQEIYLKDTEHIAAIRTERIPAYLEPIVLKAMEQYALACLEKAASKAAVVKIAPEGFTDGIQTGFQVNGYSYVVDKESITSKENLV